jgi:hypothetical protein
MDGGEKGVDRVAQAIMRALARDFRMPPALLQL